jgi:integrase
VELAYETGMRRGELCDIRVSQVDRETWRIPLEREQTKTNKPRVLSLNNYTRPLVQQMIESKSGDDRVITRSDGRPVKDLRKRWRRTVRRRAFLGCCYMTSEDLLSAT